MSDHYNQLGEYVLHHDMLPDLSPAGQTRLKHVALTTDTRHSESAPEHYDNPRANINGTNPCQGSTASNLMRCSTVVLRSETSSSTTESSMILDDNAKQPSDGIDSVRDGPQPAICSGNHTSVQNHAAAELLNVEIEAQLRFFKEMLGDIEESTLPYGLSEVHLNGAEVTESHRILPLDLNDRLRFQAKRTGVSLASLWHVACAHVLARTSGQERTVFGTVLFGGMQDEEDCTMGSINTLPFRCDIGDQSVLECVIQAHVRLAALLEHKQASLPLATQCSGVPAGTPLFSTLLNYLQTSLPSSSTSKGSGKEFVSQEEQVHYPGIEFLGERERTNYPITFNVQDFGTAFGLTVQTIQPIDPDRVGGYMVQVLESLAVALESDPDMPVSELNVLPPEERQLLLHEWNSSAMNYPQHQTIHGLFEEQVERTPHATALVFMDQSLTYAELNERANQLAHHIISLGVRPDTLVAICVERSLAMIIGVLAILKAGGAYVPLDPAYASDRLRDIMTDAAPTVAIVDKTGRLALGEGTLCSVTVVDPNGDLDTDNAPTSPPHPSNKLDQLAPNPQIAGLTSCHLAYVIYTSGSTGKPKGVMIEHHGVVNLVQTRPDVFGTSASSRVMQFLSFAFDGCSLDIFMALCCGGSLHLLPDRIRSDPASLWRYLEKESITQVILTPAVLQNYKNLPPLHVPLTLILAGEELPAPLLRVLQSLVPNGRIVNDYGPTEATVSAVAWSSTPGFSGDNVPIGRPIANKKVYILDEHNEPVPMGVAGELYIGGVGVARGYLNQPELTTKVFLPDPFADDVDARMYKTGDLARYLPDGNIVFLGRSDHQVKIRGFRIELGEIEARLNEHPPVQKAVVLALGEGSNKRLVAYVVAEQDDNLLHTLRSHLVSRLPDYMIPAAIVRLDSLPLTSNGKLDRKALPAPDSNAFAREAYEAPQGEIETAIAQIWAGLLGLDRVSRSDNFFALGGHSLLAVQMVDRLRCVHLSLSISELFKTPTLSVLALSLGQHHLQPELSNLITPDIDSITPDMLPLINLTQPEIDRIVQQVPGGVSNIQDIYTLSSLQGGIFFHHLLETKGDPYLIIICKAFVTRELLDRYVDALQRVVNRHDILRTAFVSDGLSTPAQVVWRNAPLSVTELQFDPADGCIKDQLMQRFDPRKHRIDLTQAPLLRLSFARDSDGRWLLVELLHHLVSDNSTLKQTEMEIKAFMEGRGDTLPAPQSFRNLMVQTRSEQDEMEHTRFFSEMLADIDTPSLPFGLTNVYGGGHEIVESYRELPQDLNDRLRRQARQMSVSLASLCHLAWALVISRTSGEKRVVFGTVLLGRMQSGLGTDSAMGLFINTLPLRIDLDGSVHEVVLQTHARLAGLIEYEHASLAVAQRCSGVPQGTPLFSSILNYRHKATSWDDTHIAPGIELVESHERTNYPFSVAVDDSGTGLGLTVKVVRPLDSDRVNGYMQQALESLADVLEHNHNMLVHQIDVLPVEERQLLLTTWNDTEQDYPAHLCIHHLFEQQVERTPQATALVFMDQSLTYAELNDRANRLAFRLVGLGVQPDTLVAICVERSLAMIIGMLAILKAGGAYVPLDPSYASDRLRDIVADAAPTVIVADKSGRTVLGVETLCSVTVVDPNADPDTSHAPTSSFHPTVTTDQPASNPQISGLTSRHLAYVIYTSGSTGKPKGVLIEHQGVVNLIHGRPEMFGIHPSSRILQFTSLSFDHSVSEIFTALTRGASLHLVQDDVRLDRRQLCNYLEQNQITHISLTPALLQDANDMPVLNTLKTLIVMGEAFTTALIPTLQRIISNGWIINSYGPTETTVSTITWRCPREFTGDIVPMGRPIPNKRIYLLDGNGQPVPLGAIGELYIGGVGVARGYLNRPELTTKVFLPDPFADDVDARMYKTGDLARYLPDGNIVFLGRNDHQVKIRGFRIELGEIEARLNEHPPVQKAVVLALGEGSNKRLVAYVVAEQDDNLLHTLRSHLVSRLPDYMIPAAIVRLDSLPLTSNGKLDRKALPAPDSNAFAREAYEAPQGEIETAIAQIWAGLLGLDRVSRSDNFFALGGHSLLAVQMVDRLRRVHLSLSISELFKTPTLSVLALSLGQHHLQPELSNLITPDIDSITPDMLPLINLTQPEIDRIVQQVPGGVSNIQDIYTLSSLQGGILFHHLLETKGDPYLLIICKAFVTRELLDRYVDALQRVVNRHDILRTAFVSDGLSTPAQVVWRNAPLSVTELQFNPADGCIKDQLMQRFDPRKHRIDLTQAPLLRLSFARDSDGRWLLVELLHHLVSDHSTLEQMGMEIKAFMEGQGDTLPTPQSFRNLMVQTRSEQDEMEHTRFFSEMLADIDTPSLPFGLANVYGDGSEIAVSYRELPQELNDRLRRQAKQMGVSLASLCHLAWALVISRTSGEKRVVFGTVLLGRMQSGLGTDSAMGLFINTLPLRVDLDGGVHEVVLQTHARLAELLDHEHASLAIAQRCSSVPQGTPLFSSMLNYRHNATSWDDTHIAPGIELMDGHERTNYPVVMSVEDSSTGLGLTVEAVRTLDPDRVNGYMKQALEGLADALEHNHNMLVNQIDVLPMDERQLLLNAWNDTQQDYPAHLCIHHLFEQQVERIPQATALVFMDQSLTYAELNERANRFAQHLIGLGVQPETLVAICVERSFAMIVGLLGILKAGGAYVPLDPMYASDRLRDILEDASPSIVVADEVGRSVLGREAMTSMTVVDPNTMRVHYSSESNQLGSQIPNPQIPGLASRHLAYIIYTSGSTGKPKGVMIEHQGVVNHTLDRLHVFNMDESSQGLQFSSVGFDYSVLEIFTVLSSGASLHLLQNDIRSDMVKLWDYIRQHSITQATLTPVVLQDCKNLSPLSTPLRFTLGGDALPPSLLRTLQPLLPEGSVISNEYGPTETTIAAIRWKTSTEFDGDIVPIGRPIANKKVYVLDKHGQPVPLGAVGELYIGGVGVARGYLNQPEMTAKAFLSDPFVDDPEARMYKTGDLVRYLSDGNIVFLGRDDHQVKLRGFRIELGEIEARLSEHPLVQNTAVVTLGEGSSKRLVAYVVAEPDENLPHTLRSHLISSLPDYMIPAAIVRLDSLPLTPNGKLDRKALPAPDCDGFARETYEAPQGEIETSIAQIWSELLGLERVGRHDNFFTLGGHSLLAVRLMNRIASLGTQISLSALFASPSLSSFAGCVQERLGQGSDELLQITVISREGDLPLSFSQKRMWFLTQLDGVSETYHVPLAVRFRGIINLEAWQSALNTLFTRHESLRSVFINVDGEPRVRILSPHSGLPIRWDDLRGIPDAETRLTTVITEEDNTPFDMERGPLIRARMAHLDGGDYMFMLTQHHIVSDLWSMTVLFQELNALYSAYSIGESDPLPPLTIQYPDYAAWQRQWLTGDRLEAHSSYWRTTLNDAPVLLNLPTDKPRPPQQSYSGDRVPIRINSQLTRRIKQLSQEHGVTLFMTNLAAWAAVLSRLSGQDNIIIGSPTANRNHHQIEPLIGFFVNTLALRIDLSGDSSVRQLLERVKSATVGAQAHQDLPFEHVVDIVQPPRSLSHSPLFQVMFAWQNDEDTAWDLPGIEAIEVDTGYGSVTFDLDLKLYELDDEISGAMTYSTALFDRSTIERQIGYFVKMLEAMTADVERRVTTVDLLAQDERQLLLQTLDETEYPTDMCIHHYFEEQAERTPQATSLVFMDQSLTYSELNERANRLAHRLLRLGVEPDTLVAICVERSFAMIIGMLAILKAGGAYVPLDPAYTSHRLRAIMVDAAPTVIVADKTGRIALGEGVLNSIAVLDPNEPLDDGWASVSEPNSNPRVPGLTSRHLAYVIYTSGSTGTPKGVMLEHRGVVGLAQTHTKFCDIRHGSRVLQFASFSFDASVWDIMLPLTCGATLYLPPASVHHDRDRLWEYMDRHSLTHASFTPSFLQDGKNLPVLKTPLILVLGGEPLSPALAKNLIAQGYTVINDFGPTETTVSATTWRCPPDFQGDVVPIGRPVVHSRIYLLDHHGNLVPFGAIGELYVGGAGVARGYLNRPELTAERFLLDPFDKNPDARMYRTGDLGRFMPDGNLAFLGRNDEQVKIRGFRIELGDIDTHLSQHPLVRENVTLVRGKNGDQTLVSYFIPVASSEDEIFMSSSDETDDDGSVHKRRYRRLIRDIREWLKARLPAYSVPSVFVPLSRMPLTPNDKIDKNALPFPDTPQFDLNASATCADGPAMNPTERSIHQIWKQLLPFSPTWIPLRENFFDLGGHSILATRLIFEVRRVCCVDVPLDLVFHAPTIGGMAKEVDRVSMDLLQLDVDKPQGEENKAAEENEAEYDYSGDFETLCKTEIQAQYPRVQRSDPVDYQTFFLTGATGFLGAFILRNLLEENPAGRVICLVRASSLEKAMDRVRSCGESHLTWNEEWVSSGRLSVVMGDLSLDQFGLSSEAWEMCCRKVDVIVHNGALVHGLYPYPKVRAANVLGTLQGIKMASTYHTKPFHFVSSVSVLDTAHYCELSDALVDTNQRGVLETDDLEGARRGLRNGYGQSKWVSEKLIMTAHANGLPATIIRPGYIIGHSRTGVTNTDDFIWRLIQGCIEIGSAPDMDGVLNMCPVDYVAQCVSSAATTAGSEESMVYHITHPITPPFRFNDFFELLVKYGYEVQMTEYIAWRKTLMEYTLKTQDSALYPLLSLVMGGSSTATKSPELNDAHTQQVVVQGSRNGGFDSTPTMDEEQIGVYLAYLVKVGFLERPTRSGEGVLTLPEIKENVRIISRR